MDVGDAGASRDPEGIRAAIGAVGRRRDPRLRTGAAIRERHGHAATGLAIRPPDAVAVPGTEAEVAVPVRICAAHGGPVIPSGTGTSLEGHGNSPEGACARASRGWTRCARTTWTAPCGRA